MSPSDKVITLVRPAGTSQDMNLVLNKPKNSPYWWWSVILSNDNTNRLSILKAYYAEWNSECREAHTLLCSSSHKLILIWQQVAHISVIRIMKAVTSCWWALAKQQIFQCKHIQTCSAALYRHSVGNNNSRKKSFHHNVFSILSVNDIHCGYVKFS
jgi:hypothetical protein